MIYENFNNSLNVWFCVMLVICIVLKIGYCNLKIKRVDILCKFFLFFNIILFKWYVYKIILLYFFNLVKFINLN